jgi:predicted O-methyltransferase YrrM
VEASGLKNKIFKLTGYSKDVLRTLPANSYDFVYIDGSHVAMDVLTDAVLVWDLMKPGGTIIFDDYEWPGIPAGSLGPAHLPKTAVDAFLDVYEPYIDILHKGYQVIVRKREKVDLDSQKFWLGKRLLNLLYW